MSSATPSVAVPGNDGNVSHWSAWRAAIASIRGRCAAISSGIRGRWIGARLELRLVQLVEAATERDRASGLQPVEDLERLLEPVDAFGRRRQRDAVPAVLVLVPAGPEPEDQPPAADVVDGDRLLEEHSRMAERVARDEHAEADARRPRSERCEQRPRLVTGVLGRPVGVKQVVDEPGVIEPELLGQREVVEHLGPAAVRLAQEEAETDRWGRGGWIVRGSPPGAHRSSTHGG